MSGPVMIDLAGTTLTAEEARRLDHPAVGSVILFTRNYRDPDQLRGLTRAIQAHNPALLIAVDHEGGRVQRFRDGFTPLPAMASLGRLYDQDPVRALDLARDCGFVLAHELRQVGVDFSFTPVLDLDHGRSAVIGSRAFHRQPGVVSTLAGALYRGLKAAGMAGVAKHWPGHGWVEVDSHHGLPHDQRPLTALEQDDLLPFRALIDAGIEGIMPAHVCYDAIDPQPAGFSAFWLQNQLRQRYGFQGTIFSDDLSMGGAQVAGGPLDRAQAALAAGCDRVMCCNDAAACDEILAGAAAFPPPGPESRWTALWPRPLDPQAGAGFEQARARVIDWVREHDGQ